MHAHDSFFQISVVSLVRLLSSQQKFTFVLFLQLKKIGDVASFQKPLSMDGCPVLVQSVVYLEKT